jgi:hypothetical protein
LADLAVVHLVRKQNGLAPFRRFLDSYRELQSGAPHDLIVVFKGFNPDRITEYDALLAGLPHQRIFVADRGFDINVYFETVERCEYRHYCFLNSYSRILVAGWLGSLHQWITTAGVGLVGATASYQSISTGHIAHIEKMKAMPTLQRARASAKIILADAKPVAFLAQRAWFRILRMAGVWKPERDFPPFPNYHLRTNAFMAARETLRRIRVEPMQLKISAYKFESGTNSLTRQVQRLGLRVLVVDRDGNGYDPERWHLSNTFWQGREEDLLVGDNQTEFYLAADPATRALRSRYAWGELARPG